MRKSHLKGCKGWASLYILTYQDVLMYFIKNLPLCTVCSGCSVCTDRPVSTACTVQHLQYVEYVQYVQHVQYVKYVQYVPIHSVPSTCYWVCIQMYPHAFIRIRHIFVCTHMPSYAWLRSPEANAQQTFSHKIQIQKITKL